MRKTPLKKIGKKRKARISNGWSEKSLFLEILEKRGKTDLTGRPITPEDARSYQFAHILPKGMYPELRLNPDNIILVDSIEQHEWVDKTVTGTKAWFFDWVKREVAIKYLQQIWNNPILHPLRSEGKLPLGSDF